jgi:hypothetical protein
MSEYRMKTVVPALVLAMISAASGGVSTSAAQAPAAAPAEVVPASTLASPATATAVPNAEGFIQRWLVLEPLIVDGQTQNIVRAAVKKFALSGPETAIPHDGDTVTVAGAEVTWHARDTKFYNFNLFHYARSLGRPTSNVLFWAETVVISPVEMKDVRLAIGSNAASVWWLNGEELVGIYGDRQTVIDDGVSKRVTLKKGRNVLRAAIVNGSGATDFCARFLDANDKPMRGYTVTLGK